MNLKVERLDHLPVIAGTIRELGLIEKIDALIPPHEDEQVSTGQAIAAMIICGLERCILIEITDIDNYNKVGNSRRGGWPDFPSGWQWPLSQDGKCMVFLTQINLAEIAIYQDVLPKHGMLYFFIGGNGYEVEGEILFFDGSFDELNLKRLKYNDLKDFSLGFRPDFELEADSFLPIHYPRKLKFHSTLSIPPTDTRILVDSNGVFLDRKMTGDEKHNYIELSEDLMYPDKSLKDKLDGHSSPKIHQKIFGYEYCQTFEPRDFGVHPMKGEFKGIELYTIWDHDELFMDCIDGSIIFAVKRDELAHCKFSQIFVAIEG